MVNKDTKPDCIDHGRTRSVVKGGYLSVKHPTDKHANGACKTIGYHRLVYVESHHITLKDIQGLCIRHTCDNRRCVNPLHLITGTIAQNNRDRSIRGRSAKRVPSRQRLTNQQVAAIQLRYNPARVGVSAPDGVVALSRDYKVDTNVIYKVIRGEYP